MMFLPKRNSPDPPRKRTKIPPSDSTRSIPSSPRTKPRLEITSGHSLKEIKLALLGHSLSDEELLKICSQVSYTSKHVSSAHNKKPSGLLSALLDPNHLTGTTDHCPNLRLTYTPIPDSPDHSSQRTSNPPPLNYQTNSIKNSLPYPAKLLTEDFITPRDHLNILLEPTKTASTTTTTLSLNYIPSPIHIPDCFYYIGLGVSISPHIPEIDHRQFPDNRYKQQTVSSDLNYVKSRLLNKIKLTYSPPPHLP